MRREGTAVLNIFNDHDYNRSVITIVASIDSISKSLSVHTFVVKYLFHSFSWGKRRVSYFAAALLLLQGFSSCPLLSNPLRGKKKSFNKLCQGFKHTKKNSGWTFFWQRSQRKVYLVERSFRTRRPDKADKAGECLSYTHSSTQINWILFWRIHKTINVLHVVSGEAVLSACEKACGLIDMRAHRGVHPCMGAVDLIPIYPLGEEVGVEDCAKEARGEMLFVHVCDAWVQLWILTVSVD